MVSDGTIGTVKAGMVSADPQGFVNSLSQTLGEANRFLTAQMSTRGLKGLVPSHGDILIALFAGRPLTMQELAAKINRDPSTVTALVKRLIREGYARTERRAADRRVVEVSLTEKGAALRYDFDDISRSLLETQMQGVDEEDFQTACRVLGRIKQNFTESELI